jgi:hypothetical protein
MTRARHHRATKTIQVCVANLLRCVFYSQITSFTVLHVSVTVPSPSEDEGEITSFRTLKATC